MNKFKKIGLTALAASLVSTSAFSGELTVSGGASVGMSGHSGSALTEATAFTMGNQITFSGSGELDNGLNVSLSFVLDQADAAPAPFDGHSVSISSDALGSITFAGEGGSSAASALDTTAAGDMWDNFNSNGGVSLSDSGPGDNSIMYTTPALIEGVSASVSYNPQIAGTNETELGFSVTYTGVEGLSVSYGTTDLDRSGTATDGDQNAWNASYAFGPVTISASNNEYDVTGTSSDQETSSYKISYTVSDAISISYGSEEVSVPGSVDAEFTGISASYTSGGMTISAAMQDGENISNATGATNQVDYWSLGASFAF
jgi:outer membrane protein OmpU